MEKKRVDLRGVPLAEAGNFEVPSKPRLSDNWSLGPGESSNGQCISCMHYNTARCRRHAPKGQEGWPAVYPSDYCGDHKLPKRTMLA